MEYKLDDVFLFCSDWKTRAEIGEKFELSNVSSWSLVKYLSHLKADVMIKRGGITKKAYLYKTRQSCLDKILESN